MQRYFCLALIVMFLLPMPIFAVPGQVFKTLVNNGLLLKVQGGDIGADGAARSVRQATGGRVLAVKRIRTDSGPVYRVKVLLKGGRVRVLLVDATNGTLR